MDEIRRLGAMRAALGRAPGGAVTMLDPRPFVRVRVVYGRAIAITPTHILHEWVRHGEYHCRWDETWQVHKVAAEEWAGESLD